MNCLSGAEILVQCLKDEGVEYIFGYPGGAVLHIYDALYQQSDITHVLVRHEQGAAHAADGYARSTGKAGVVLVTSGPGATNAITGIATAYMDSSPLIVITGQVPRSVIGSDAFQEVDSVGVTRPCVKHNFLVKSIEEIAPTFKKAFYIATNGRPGPVVIDIPKDITDPDIKIPYHYPKQVNLRSYRKVALQQFDRLEEAVDLLISAKKPMIYTGGGVVISNAANELTQFVRLLGYPITSTLMGLGAYPATDSQFIGMLGMHGTYEANMGMHECDVLIAIGARFDDRVTGNINQFCPYAKIIHIDIDPSSISKNIHAHIPIIGDVKVVLKQCIEILKSTNQNPDQNALSQWWNQIKQWQNINCLQYQKSNELIKPQYVIERLYELTKERFAYVTSDVGQHQMWVAQLYKFDQPRHWINSGGLGTMGFGLPAAMGVQFAYPESLVACVTGEASIQMCIQELSTCKQYDLPIKIINLNNRYMGMVRQWQEFFYDRRYSHSYVDALPDFVKLAEAYGHVGIRIEKPSDIEAALKEAFALKDRLVFLDFITDQTENVYPMIAAGKGHHEMHLSAQCNTL
ncbi:biosynthetic-type acetolactate synthase large subunit [Candidatus Nitrosacidococcus sp. I8]|uniref:biosynthetic-type acetolactate synthase large subunit n=1 Tax=Candidatus Nitrosacidococcus sp. I8 TaxID=2942908 RepID=UPI0022260B45|nr:biosynthetic-type acetolactate synthase large subunit [Candidatus Nitrosacidococcus sp. I8]CAH9019106.1 Acetolactate synthase isozyme 3 large subunit [Candidatus Nitrosacidococcus sp. I8]